MLRTWVEKLLPPGVMAVLSCRYCLMGRLPRYRPETKEMCHDIRSGRAFAHVFCKGTKHWKPNG